MTVTGSAVGVGTMSWPDASSVLAAVATTPHPDMAALREAVVQSPVRVALHRAEVFTKVFQATEDEPWGLRKAMALREYFRTVPLHIRDHDLLAAH